MASRDLRSLPAVDEIATCETHLTSRNLQSLPGAATPATCVTPATRSRPPATPATQRLPAPLGRTARVNVLRSYILETRPRGRPMGSSRIKQVGRLTRLRHDVLQSICDIAARRGMTRVIVFGSRARGDHRGRSDIDLAVIGGDVTNFIPRGANHERNGDSAGHARASLGAQLRRHAADRRRDCRAARPHRHV